MDTEILKLAVIKRRADTRQSENFTPAAKAFAEEFDISWDLAVHGFSGPVQSSYPVFQFPSISTFLALLDYGYPGGLLISLLYIEYFFRGWNSLGITTTEDPGAGQKSGVFWAPSTLDPMDETRSYARTAHYDRVIGSRPNYHLLTKSAVQRISIRDGKARGVEYIDRDSNKPRKVKAHKEVILAAGSVHSPQILQLSGIGPEDVIAELGIELEINLPGVGQNFQDHPTIYAAFGCTSSSDFPFLLGTSQAAN
jgi:choline dehydrogenase